MRERTADADPRFCELLCCAWHGDHCGLLQVGSMHPGQCGWTMQYKLDVLRREYGGTRDKTWLADYAERLKALKGSKND